MSETRLMTYADLGEALGRSEIAARSVAIRKRWRRVPGNDGKTRVAVPIDLLEKLQAKAAALAARRPEPQPDEQPAEQPDAQPIAQPDDRADARALIAMLEARVAELASEVKEGRAAITRVAVLEALLETERERLAEIRQDRDRWHAAATARRSWWPWRRSA
jgi:hypothetical protein